ncbi:hypothetical protein QBE52_00520 [Clostridiaceae bacterium 35-E11]
MNHFSKEMWLFYKEGKLSWEESQGMEDHLTECNQCLETFLSLMNEEEIDVTNEIISPEFTDTVMNEIHRVKHDFATKKKVPKSKRKRLFNYYVAAAVVTLVLMGSGFFESLVNTIPYMTQAAVREENFKQASLIMNFSEKIVHKTSKFINDFEISDQRRN